MADSPEDRFRAANTVKVPAVLIAQDGDPRDVLKAGIYHPVRIPVQIIVKRPARKARAGKNPET